MEGADRRTWRCRGAAVATFAALCVIAALSAGVADAAPVRRIAFMAATSQNGFNQAVWDGIRRAAGRLGVQVRIFDGGFDATLQYNQIEDVTASRKYEGLIVLPNDSVGVATAIRKATAAGLKTVAVLFPIGPDLNAMRPQVPGIVATVATPPVRGAELQAEDVVRACARKAPCRVVIVIGQKVYPFDNLRYHAYRAVLDRHPNIRVVATIEGDYDASTTMTGMLDALQVNPHIDAVLSPAEVQTLGAEMALKSYGVDPASVYLTGGGGSKIGLDAIRQGRWGATYASLPRSMGERALETLVAALDGKAVDPVIDADALSPLPPIWTKKVLDGHPDFRAEWPG